MGSWQGGFLKTTVPRESYYTKIMRTDMSLLLGYALSVLRCKLKARKREMLRRRSKDMHRLNRKVMKSIGVHSVRVPVNH